VLVGDTVYVRNLVVDRAHRRRGHGRALLLAMLDEGRAAGASRGFLYVEPHNTSAIELYLAHGFERRSTAAVLRVRFDAAPGWADAGERHALPLDAASLDEAMAERQLGLLTGQIKLLRDQGRALFVAFDREELVGFAAFDPRFPGAFPFRARDLGASRVLVEALHERARPEDFPDDWRRHGVQIVIEGNEALADALRAHGAELALRTLAMEAPTLGSPRRPAPGGPDIGRPT
jgi:hypothetical protein